jgi:hypothetical protein
MSILVGTVRKLPMSTSFKRLFYSVSAEKTKSAKELLKPLFCEIKKFMGFRTVHFSSADPSSGLLSKNQISVLNLDDMAE